LGLGNVAVLCDGYNKSKQINATTAAYQVENRERDRENAKEREREGEGRTLLVDFDLEAAVSCCLDIS